MEEDPVFVLFDLCRHFEERHNHGRGLGLGERRVLERVRTQGMVEDIGGTREQEPQGVGQEGGRRGAITVEVAS